MQLNVLSKNCKIKVFWIAKTVIIFDQNNSGIQINVLITHWVFVFLHLLQSGQDV